MKVPRGKCAGQSKGQDSRGFSIRANRRSESTSERVGSEMTSRYKCEFLRRSKVRPRPRPENLVPQHESP